jgi:ribosomal protein S18 acetylase RimI-like enzyme
MTNEQKADRLEEMAFDSGYRDQESDAALLRECAAMMRERGKVQWVKVAGSATRHIALYRGWLLEIDKNRGWWHWSMEAANFYYGRADTLEAAQAAAVAWLDEQEGK